MRVQIIGAGEVGSTIAFGLLFTDITDDIVLVDIDKKKLKSQHEDLKRARNFTGKRFISIAIRNKPCPTADVHIITAGHRRDNDETDQSLYERNISIVDEIISKLYSGRVIIVTNPAEMISNALAIGNSRRLYLLHAGDRCDNSGYTGKSIMEGKNGVTNFGIAMEVIEMLKEFR